MANDIEKIDEINNSASRIKVAIFGLFTLAFVGMTTFRIFPFSFVEYVKASHFYEMLSIVPFMVIVIVVHELIHVLFFHLFGKGQARIKVVYQDGSLIMHQVNANVFYTKRQISIVLMAPLFVLTMLLYAFMAITHLMLVSYVTILLNAVGSCVDVYLTCRILMYSGDIYLNFDKDDIKMNVFRKRADM